MLIDLLTGANPAASWTFALALLVVASAVVWLLLHMVAGTALKIEAEVAEVWERGQRVANNTIHTVKLIEIAAGVEAILQRAGGVATSAHSIKAHAEACPGCPECFLGRS